MTRKIEAKKDDELIGKNIAYYQTFLAAWIENRMEKDKQILLLSSLAIGLLITFNDKLNYVSQQVMWIFAGIPFIVAIFLALSIFSKNSDYVESLIRSDHENTYKKREKELAVLTKYSFISFAIGVVITFLLVITIMFKIDILSIF